MTEQEIIQGLNALREKDIIAWMYHTSSSIETSSKCYVKPQYVLENNEWKKINSELFPDFGSLVVVLVKYDLKRLIANEIKYEYQDGCPVRIKINKLFTAVTTEDQDSYINKNYEYDKTKFVLKYNKDYTESRSDIWFRPLPETFCHVLEIQSSFDTLNSSREKTLSIEDSAIYPFSTQVFLKTRDALYGSCSHDKRGDIIYLYGTPRAQYMINKYRLSECKLYAIRDYENRTVLEFFLHDTQSLKAIEQYDWIPEERLLSGFLDAVKNDTPSTNIAVKELKNKILTSAIRNTDIAFTPERIERIKSNLDLYLKDNAQINDIIIKCSIANNEIFSFLVKKITEDYPDEFWRSYKATYPEAGAAERRLEELKKKITEKEIKLKNLDMEEHQQNNSAQVAKLTSALGDLKNEYDLLQSELNEYKEQEGLLESLKQKIKEQETVEKYVRGRIDSLKVEEEQIQAQTNRLLKEFGNALDATARAVDLKLLDTVLKSVEERREENNRPEYHFASPEGLSMPSRDEILDNVTSFVQYKARRNMSRNDIANYLICITQGFITTFAGEPGTGKTSLCNILAKSLGLVQEDLVRFIDISVERGWTSHKEFIGYYNPLTKRLEPSNAEVFSAFEQLNKEAKSPYDPKQFSLFLILLDEANLSPLEHYWAAFLRNCDFDSTNNRTISLGGNTIFHLPEHLRFLATVNFDHTTEELSPRFLDRSWVITLEPTTLDENSSEEIDIHPLKISFDALQTAFAPIDNTDINMDDQMEDKWEKIQAIFSNEKCNLPIMPRNLRMVRSYINTACQCMDLSSNKTKFAPLDYALAQKILPTINGSGDNYKFLIDALLEECKIETMPISAKHLKRMQRVADKNLGYYQFFAR